MICSVIAKTGLVSALSVLNAGIAWGQFAPGKGLAVIGAGDDFEASNWTFTHNLPKSSSNQDSNVRAPTGVSTNGRWEESTTRGQPDVLERVACPSGGLPGSNFALRVRSRNSGIPGSPSGQLQQDDLIGRIRQIPGISAIPVAKQPSLVARIRIPPPEQWEWSVFNAFSFRAAVTGTNGQGNWPGIFFQLNRSARTVTLIARANQFNQDYNLTASLNYDTLLAADNRNGWMTIGFSFTSDGQMHYYAGLGAGVLGDVNRLDSRFPGNQPVATLDYFFSSTVNTDNGVTWSPEFHLDDVEVCINDGTPINIPRWKQIRTEQPFFRAELSGLTVGAKYRIERSFTMAPGSWVAVEDFLATSAARPWESQIASDTPQVFFRAKPAP